MVERYQFNFGHIEFYKHEKPGPEKKKDKMLANCNPNFETCTYNLLYVPQRYSLKDRTYVKEIISVFGMVSKIVFFPRHMIEEGICIR